MTKPKKPDNRPPERKAPLKRRLKLADGTAVTLHPGGGPLRSSGGVCFGIPEEWTCGKP